MFADDFDSEDDDYQPMVMLGFASFDDLINFITWVNDTFDKPADLKDYFDKQYELHRSEYQECTREPSNGKLESDFEFWNIVKNSFKNHHEGPSDKLFNTD